MRTITTTCVLAAKGNGLCLSTPASVFAAALLATAGLLTFAGSAEAINIAAGKQYSYSVLPDAHTAYYDDGNYFRLGQFV